MAKGCLIFARAVAQNRAGVRDRVAADKAVVVGRAAVYLQVAEKKPLEDRLHFPPALQRARVVGPVSLLGKSKCSGNLDIAPVVRTSAEQG